MDEMPTPRTFQEWQTAMHEAIVNAGFELSRAARHYDQLAALVLQTRDEFDDAEIRALDSLLSLAATIEDNAHRVPAKADGWLWRLKELWMDRDGDWYPLPDGSASDR